MAKLNQIIAVEKGVKSKSLQDLTEAHHDVQKPTLWLNGRARRLKNDLPASNVLGCASERHAGPGG